MKTLIISFSGGETSAYMTYWLLRNRLSDYDATYVVFANTGEEDEETLIFVRNCDLFLGFHTIWIEAVIHPERGKGPTHRVVTFETASRDGTPFEDMIKKYGIPNAAFPHCTRSLKTDPIKDFVRSITQADDEVHMAVGIRDDEVDRMSSRAKENGIIYPLISDHPMTKPEINAWWSSRPFRLKLPAWRGNCKWCWKKTDRKHFRNLQERPDYYDFPKRMESNYARVGPEFRKDPLARPRRFFRKHRSANEMHFRSIGVDVSNLQDSNEFDVGGGCGDSCEVFADE